ncbi:hypothetical protein HB662_06685 [Roseomonas frigidaquae]|uniref:Transmembrane protein n=1 Tax=Falsiroseomonas frigidaquae TaxID=487318 RepID=A0ABX1EUY9_9PROT|nr:hypothetical protein [Falsiroseomonas frigidaquae]NKE44456.1 hypothetical protein [Falsiroseomonas frigidaquae]
MTASHPGTTLRILGALLLAIGLAGYLLPAGPVHGTALIPAGLGALAILAAWQRRGPALVTGFVICALALFGGGSALAQVPALLAGEAGAAAASRVATALVAGWGLVALLLALRRQPA